ncbi:MAG TPA: hotdog domain-containing protein [Actinomycetota bacterium]|nr:hotdog domain-containing protein [Actinomycetota bacterium]
MPERPTLGEEVTHRIVVTPEMTARLFDREVHPVYATAWLVRHVEEAGRLLIQRHLGPDEDATGYRIELTHERAAAVGEAVTIVARVTAVDERACTIGFEARIEAGVVGRGSFVQRYVPRGRMGLTSKEEPG